MNKGLLSGFGAYFLWGIFPVYWKLLSAVPAQEILAHRIFWSFLFLLGLIAFQGNWAWLRSTFADKRAVVSLAIASLLLSLNWVVYIWAVNAGFIVETSLGYFINPLINVLFGRLFFGERLRKPQLLAIGLACLGVLYLTWVYGRPPWIALTLALSFGIYGVFKKRSVLKSAESLTFETAVVFPVALVFLAVLQLQGGAAFVNHGLSTTLLLALTGIATAIPLMMFAYGAQNVTLTTMGILQYTAPTMQFALGVLLYREPFDQQQLIGFLLIWSALVLYSAESFLHYRHNRLKPLTA